MRKELVAILLIILKAPCLMAQSADSSRLNPWSFHFQLTVIDQNHAGFHSSYSGITFAYQLPLPREGFQLDYSRWQQNLLTILIPEVLYDSRMERHSKINVDEHINSTVQMKIRLAVRNIGDKDWKLYAQKDSLKRTISCQIDANKV